MLSNYKQSYFDWYTKYYQALLNTENINPPTTLTGEYQGYKVTIKEEKLYFGSTELIPYSETIYFAKTGYKKSNNGDLMIEFDDAEQPNQLFYTVLKPSGEIGKISLQKE